MGGLSADGFGAVAATYDLGRVLQVGDDPARGLQGQVWRLITTAGVWAVKEANVPFSEAEARQADEFADAARRGGVPAPAARLTRGGRHVALVGDTAIRVQAWVDLDPPDPHLDPASVGAMLGSLHRVSLPAGASPHWWYTEPVGAATWDTLVDECQAAAAPFADRLAAIRDDLVALEMIMTPMTPVQRCHLDLWADNVRGTPGGGLCVIDWDNSGPADPSRELALVLYEFGRTDRHRLRTLYDAYRDQGAPGQLRDPADFAMLAAQLGHIGAMHLRRWLDPSASTAERDGARRGIEEFVGDPFTTATMIEIIAALD
jgi:Ser/Thr protein kinase RdoA (MazF antagonist)